MNNTAILEALNTRYATQEFDASKTISAEDLDTLIESMRLAPSSYGVQPWWFVIVSDPALKEKLLPVAYGQKKVVQAPYLFVLCHRTDVNSDYVHSLAESLGEQRGIAIDQLASLEQAINGMLASKDEQQLNAWLTKQVYIPLGFLLQTAAMLGIDAGPMEGFSHHDFDKILGLAEHNLTSCVIVAVGYRSANDATANAPKARKKKKKVVIMK